MYVCGPTVYNYVHIGNARPAWCSACWPRCCAGATATCATPATSPTSTTRSTLPRAEQGVPISAITDRFAAGLPRGHGRARRGAAGRRTRGDRAHPADHRDDRAPDRRRPRLRRGRPRAVRGRHASRTTASCRGAIPTTCWPARGSKWRRTSAIPATSCCGSRPPTICPAGIRPGAAAARAGTSSARRWPRRTWARPSTSTPAASTCSSRTTRTRSRRANARTAARSFARFWLHNGMLNFGGAKMSKSLGNIEKVHDLLRVHPPEALRHALLSAHYRQPLEWSERLIEQTVRTLDRLYGTLRDWQDIRRTPAIPRAASKPRSTTTSTRPQALAEDGRASQARRASPRHCGGGTRARLKARTAGRRLALGLLQQDPAGVVPRGSTTTTRASRR